MTKEQFLTWSMDQDTLYEFDNGFAEPTSTMKKAERYLIVNIQDKFAQSEPYRLGGRLLPETDVWVSPLQMRVPDLAFFTRDDIRIVDEDKEPIPAFVVELISPTDRADKVEQKVHEYFQAGVQVVWHIHPALQMVRTFTSLNTSTAYFDGDTFDASPVLPDLRFSVQELFSR